MSDPGPIVFDPAETAAMLGPEGVDPAQPAPVLGAAPSGAADFPCEGSPPFINRRLTIAEFRAYLASYAFGSIAPTRLVLHHTWSPTEAQWRGLASMRAMQAYYAGLGWTAAPHLYAGPDGIWLATPMSRVGIHAGTGNGSVAQGWYSIGLEMVGDFDVARPAGAVWANALAVMAGLLQRLSIPPRQLISFHRDYSPKSCPGRAVAKEWVWTEVEAALAPPALPTPLPVIGVTPSIARGTFTAVLRDHGAPFAAADATVIADRLYDLCLWLDIDPAFFLALWLHEQGDPLGGSPVGRATRNPLNLKAYGPRWPSLTIGAVAWNSYSSWQIGCMHAILHLKEIYGAHGLQHVENILPMFAPADDQNNVPAYIASVRRDMAAMQAREASRA
jgi:hypothetical protein